MQFDHSSVVLNTFATMGINTAVFQIGIVSRVKVNTIMPASAAIRLNIKEGNFKFEMLPVTLPENIATVQ